MSPQPSTNLSNKPAPKPGGSSMQMSKSVMIVGLIVVAAVLVVGAYLMGNHSQKNSPASSSSDAALADSGQKLAIKELGVQISLPMALKDSTYKVQAPPAQFKTAPTVVQLQLSSYSVMAKKCVSLPSGIEPAYAALIKTVGTSSPAGVANLKQFNSFYIADLGPSVAKGSKCKDIATQKSFDALTASLTTALQNAFSNAVQTN